jgi:glycosyltransferase involved in cell wall biosynthesis
MARLIVDAQLFQTPAWDRGMGKYSLELLSALLRANQKVRRWSSIEILMSSNMPQDTSLLETIERRLKGESVTFLDFQPNAIFNESVAGHNRTVIDSHVTLSKTEHIDYLVLSLMQGEIWPAFPSDSRINKFLLCYDLIPLILHKTYLESPITRKEYLSKLAELFRADFYLAISKTVANDLSLYTGIDPKRIYTIDGGPIDHGKKSQKLAIPSPFILMPTGNDLRKNNHRAILGFKAFNKRHMNAYSLIITSYFKEQQIDELSKLSPNVIFTGNITGEELNYLYENTEAVLFPSEYEGLGLPVLEALQNGKPVACSNIAVFREMSASAFYYFDYKDPLDISRALSNALNIQIIDKDAYQGILHKYSWENTAQKALQVFTDALNDRQVVSATTARVAIFGPDPSGITEIGKLLQMSYAEFIKLFSADYYIQPRSDPLEPRIGYLPYITRTTDSSVPFTFEPADYDAVFYYIANEKACASSLFAALARPGIVVLHDLVLDKVWKALLDDPAFIDSSRYKLEERLNDSYSEPGTQFLASLVASQKTIVVFNDEAVAKLRSLIVKLKKTPKIIKMQLPFAGVVHPDILPNKAIAACTIGQTNSNALTDYQNIDQFLSTKTDAEYLEILLSSRTIVCAETFPSGSNALRLSSAMQLGLIPLVLTSQAHSELPAISQKKQMSEIIHTIEEMSMKESKFDKTSSQVMIYAQSKHTYRTYAEQMSKLLRSVPDKGTE